MPGEGRYPGLWSFLQLASAVALGSLVWLLCSLPLVTLPAATAGLYAVAGEASKGLDFNLFAVFWAGMRRHWRRATALWVTGAALTAVLLFDAWFFAASPGWLQALGGVALSLLLLVFLVNLYAWPLLIRTDWRLRRLLQVSALLAGAHLIRSLLTAAGAGLILAVAWRFPPLYLVAVPGAVALLSTWSAGRILGRYLPAAGDDGQEDGQPD